MGMSGAQAPCCTIGRRGKEGHQELEMDDLCFMLFSPLGVLIRMETTVDAKHEPLFGQLPEYLNDGSAPLHTNTTPTEKMPGASHGRRYRVPFPFRYLT
jgi:hypothetical protein